MQHEHEGLQAERGDEGFQIASLILDPVGDRGLVGPTHADEVGRDTAGVGRDMGDDVMPKVG